jgi:hypothetical protein
MTRKAAKAIEELKTLLKQDAQNSATIYTVAQIAVNKLK